MQISHTHNDSSIVIVTIEAEGGDTRLAKALQMRV